MITDEKIKEMRKRLQKGEPEGEIKEQLQKDGYSQEEINQIFKPHQYDMRLWYLIFGILISGWGVITFIKTNSLLILVLGGGLFFAYYREEERVKKEK
jgi:hypothetical protein